VVLSAEPRLWLRIVTVSELGLGFVVINLSILLIVILLIATEKFVSGRAGVSVQRTLWLLSPMLGVAVASAVAVAVTGAFAVTVTGAFSGTVAVVLSVAFSLAVANAVTVIVELLAWRGRGTIAYALLTALLALMLALTAAVLPWESTSPARRSVFLFFGILPLLNGLFDFFSYGATLTLIRLGLRARGWALALGFADLAIAAVLFLASGAALVVVSIALNRVSGVTFVPLGAIFDGVRSTPGAYWWLMAMLFSTVLPTGLHFCLAAFSLQGLVPLSARRRLIG